MKNLFASTKSKVIAGVVALFVLLGGVVAGTLAYFGAHALPGSTIAGHDVGGQSREQVMDTLQGLIDQQKVEIEGPNGDVTPVDFEQAGVLVDVDATVDQVFHNNEGFADRVRGLFGSNDVEPVVVADQAKLESYADSIEFSGESEPVDAAVHFDNDSKMFVVSASSEGNVVDANALGEELLAAASTLGDATVTATSSLVEPTLTTEIAQTAAEKANQWTQMSVKVTDAELWTEWPEPEDIASWIKFEPEDGTLEPVVDKAEVTKWVNKLADATKAEPVPGVQNVNSDGKVLAVANEGQQGREVNNVDKITVGILDAFKTETPYTADFEYTLTEPTFEQRLIAPGAESLSYQAAPGERWIDISLSTYTVTAYEGATPVMQIPTAHGAPTTPTLPGSFAIYAKIPLQDMRGTNPDGSKYLTKDVPWVLYYDGNYAVHGAPWRSAFGFEPGEGGSHGCVNIPAMQAKELYDWASIGNKVVVHY
ncbi:L,D-transpeptidase family protein [Actinomycetaceae bacterium MB13-C1-2]|nr:L,D-transpeptidase family protein [Actinomycetaceae bacterium MB13-C1-2]